MQILTDSLQATIKHVLCGSQLFDHSVVVASPGRSGSTVLYDTLTESFDRHPRWLRANAWNLESAEFRKGLIYKTHSPAKPLPLGVRSLYVYRTPAEIVHSTLKMIDTVGPAWGKSHCEHLLPHKAPIQVDRLRSGLQTSDLLDIHGNLKTWLECSNSVLFLKYEAMWDHQEKISDFVGFPVELPQYRASKTVGEVEGYAAYLDLYNSLPDMHAI
ncbi:hypothetical protein [Leisingera daeponensis]|uniref:hypothetical protein n=1 Tax=Leisingera daeponensis TaxID=405746 RepID=UPI001C97533C|nr:hypothetical protein [Leisingera daeponensis]MBY6059429.1 hypothetical protein [Leisingera daeponensis]